jgi:hypothetical protein
MFKIKLEIKLLFDDVYVRITRNPCIVALISETPNLKQLMTIAP